MYLSWPFRYRLQTVRSLAGVSLMLRLLWACLRWDDMAVKPSSAVGTTRKGEKIQYKSCYAKFRISLIVLEKSLGVGLHFSSSSSNMV